MVCIMVACVLLIVLNYNLLSTPGVLGWCHWWDYMGCQTCDEITMPSWRLLSMPVKPIKCWCIYLCPATHIDRNRLCAFWLERIWLVIILWHISCYNCTREVVNTSIFKSFTITYAYSTWRISIIQRRFLCAWKIIFLLCY